MHLSPHIGQAAQRWPCWALPVSRWNILVFVCLLNTLLCCKNAHQVGNKGRCQGTLLIRMVGIDFGNGETGELWAGDEHFKTCHRLLESEASIDLWHVSDREINKVDHIHVEM